MAYNKYKIIVVSVAVALVLWSAFNILDWTVERATESQPDIDIIIFGLVFVMNFVVLIYFGATQRLLQK